MNPARLVAGGSLVDGPPRVYLRRPRRWRRCLPSAWLAAAAALVGTLLGALAKGVL
jgi:hypothetical protein